MFLDFSRAGAQELLKLILRLTTYISWESAFPLYICTSVLLLASGFAKVVEDDLDLAGGEDLLVTVVVGGAEGGHE